MANRINFYFILAITCSSLFAGDFVKEVAQRIDRVFVPHGYDANDSVRFVVEGRFKNACYQIGGADAEVNSDEKEIQLRILANEYDGDCPEVNTPFHHVFFLGRISKPGTYKILDQTTKRRLGKLVITPANEGGSGTDDVVYVPLLDAFLLKHPHSNELVLRGVFPTNCMSVKEVGIEVQSDVVVVRPASKIVIDDQRCHAGEFPFEYRFNVKNPLPKSSYLLHVRSMGGQAINKMMH